MSRPSAPLQERFDSRLAALCQPHERICVGFSGGLDSLVLLQLCLQAAANIRERLSAVHVHHGLSPNADAWADFCADFCARTGVAFELRRVSVDRSASVGLEAAAREARYEVYRQVDAECIALAHHADDAAETLLLRLLRGTGIKGLAGMAAQRRLDEQRRIIRPLLPMRRAELLAFAQSRQLHWIEDESNADAGFDRNFLRHEILARIDGRFPGYPDTLLRAAENAAEAQLLLDELAHADLGDDIATLSVARLRELSPLRARNALRAFLDAHDIAMPDAARLHEAVRQIQGSAADAGMVMALGGGELRQSGDRLLIVGTGGGGQVAAFECAWQGEAELALPALGGVLQFRPAQGAGIAGAATQTPGWTLRSRQGGETLKPAANRPSRTLKNLFQEHRIPHWERTRLPLLFHGTKLVWVPGLGVDSDYQCPPGAAGIVPHWQPTAPK